MGLVGCGGGEVPPSPDAPGGVAGEYSVAVDELGSWAVQNEVAIITPDYLKLNVANPNGSVDILVEDDAIWNTYYIYDFQIEEWIVDTFEDESYKDSGWILPSAAPKAGVTGISTTLDQISLDNVGDYLLAFYSCTKVNSWDCHGGWQVEAFNVTKDTLEDISFTVDVSGTQDDSKIILELAGNEVPYTDIEIVIELNENFFNVAESGGTYDKQAYNSAARSTPEEIIVPVHENNFNESPITLYGAWNQDGAYDISVYARAINYDEQSAKSTHVGEISLTLPDLPGAVGLDDSLFENCIGDGEYSINVNGDCYNQDSLVIDVRLASAGFAELEFNSGGFLISEGQGCTCSAPAGGSCTYPEPGASQFEISEGTLELSRGTFNLDLELQYRNKNHCGSTYIELEFSDGSIVVLRDLTPEANEELIQSNLITTRGEIKIVVQ